jgi:hypothetical protein
LRVFPVAPAGAGKALFNDLKLLSVVMIERVYVFFQGRQQNQEKE